MHPPNNQHEFLEYKAQRWEARKQCRIGFQPVSVLRLMIRNSAKVFQTASGISAAQPFPPTGTTTFWSLLWRRCDHGCRRRI
jgi:hypothetical protein